MIEARNGKKLHDLLTACTPNQAAAFPIKCLTRARGTAHNHCCSTKKAHKSLPRCHMKVHYFTHSCVNVLQLAALDFVSNDEK